VEKNEKRTTGFKKRNLLTVEMKGGGRVGGKRMAIPDGKNGLANTTRGRRPYGVVETWEFKSKKGRDPGYRMYGQKLEQRRTDGNSIIFNITLRKGIPQFEKTGGTARGETRAEGRTLVL